MTAEFKCYKLGDFVFASRYWENSRAWGHECYLLDGVRECGRARYRYYNRTWECYTFQSVMFGAVEDYKKRELERYLNNKKIAMGLKGWNDDGEFEKSWPRGMKKKLAEEFEDTPEGKIIKKLHEFVERRK